MNEIWDKSLHYNTQPGKFSGQNSIFWTKTPFSGPKKPFSVQKTPPFLNHPPLGDVCLVGTGLIPALPKIPAVPMGFTQFAVTEWKMLVRQGWKI